MKKNGYCLGRFSARSLAKYNVEMTQDTAAPSFPAQIPQLQWLLPYVGIQILVTKLKPPFSFLRALKARDQPW